jgi:ATP-dependent Clp protease protease subunit
MAIAPPPPPAPQRVYLLFSLAITAQTVTKLLTECASWANQGTKEIYLLFASLGGNVPAGIAAYNALRSKPVKLITHNIGNVDSIANIIFLAGQERLAVPHSTFMFHGVRYEVAANTSGDLPFYMNRVELINADHKKMASIIKERATFDTVDEIMALFTSQATKEADYALAHGIVHKIEHHQIPAGSRTLVFSE